MTNYQQYQAGTENSQHEAPTHTGARVTIRDTVTFATTNDGVMTGHTAGHDKGSTAELNPYYGTDTFGATAQNPDGSPVTELLPTTLVKIDGVQAPISFWVNEGRRQKGSDGKYTEAAGQAVEAPKADANDFLPIDRNSMDRLNHALEPLPQENLDSLMATAVGIAAGRLDQASLATQFANVTGRELNESQARMEAVQAIYQAQANEALTSRNGLSPADLPKFYEWARTQRRELLQEAIQKQLLTHDVSGYKALATQWRSRVAPSIEAFKAQGIPVRQQGQSHEVFIRGQWMSPGAAARAGLA